MYILNLLPFLLLPLTLTTAAPDLENAGIHRLPLSRTYKSHPLQIRSYLSPREVCSGDGVTCVGCFGAGYIDCPDGITCYNPDDPTTSCTGDSPPDPGSTTDHCQQAGATCVSCFGAGYINCPGDATNCYDPSDPKSFCPNDGPNPPNNTPSDPCVEKFGPGNIDCGPDSCYNPDAGETCCDDGNYCKAGYLCSSIVSKCCRAGSSGCGSVTGLSSSATTPLRPTTTIDLQSSTTDFTIVDRTPTADSSSPTTGTNGPVLQTPTISTQGGTTTTSASTETNTGAAVALGVGYGNHILIAGGVGVGLVMAVL